MSVDVMILDPRQHSKFASKFETKLDQPETPFEEQVKTKLDVLLKHHDGLCEHQQRYSKRYGKDGSKSLRKCLINEKRMVERNINALVKTTTAAQLCQTHTLSVDRFLERFADKNTQLAAGTIVELRKNGSTISPKTSHMTNRVCYQATDYPTLPPDARQMIRNISPLVEKYPNLVVRIRQMNPTCDVEYWVQDPTDELERQLSQAFVLPKTLVTSLDGFSIYYDQRGCYRVNDATPTSGFEPITFQDASNLVYSKSKRQIDDDIIKMAKTYTDKVHDPYSNRGEVSASSMLLYGEQPLEGMEETVRGNSTQWMKETIEKLEGFYRQACIPALFKENPPPQDPNYVWIVQYPFQLPDHEFAFLYASPYQQCKLSHFCEPNSTFMKIPLEEPIHRGNAVKALSKRGTFCVEKDVNGDLDVRLVNVDSKRVPAGIPCRSH